MNPEKSRFVLMPLHHRELSPPILRAVNSLIAQLTGGEVKKLDQTQLRLFLKSGIMMIVARDGADIVGLGVVCRVQRLLFHQCEINDIVVDAKYLDTNLQEEILSRLCTEARLSFGADLVVVTCDTGDEKLAESLARCRFSKMEKDSFVLTFKKP